MTALTPANQLTLLRMLLIPAFVILVVYGHLGWALVAFAVAGVTDALDGLIARRSGQKSNLGAWLDPMADKLLLLTTFVVLTLPGLGLSNRLPIWLTVLIFSRDVVIVLTVAVVNLAIGPRTFRPSIFGKVATATYIVTAVVAMFFNYRGYASPVVEFFVWASLAVTLISSFHYIWHARQIIGAVVFLPFFFVPLSAQTRQAVVETSAGIFILDLLPDAAPAQVAHFVTLAEAGAYEGTTFHRMVRFGIVQGGDPISKDPAKRSLYGTGGLSAVKAEARAAKMTRGSVAAVLVPGRPDSGGAQFFVSIVDQPGLDGQYTVFARVWDGIEVLQKISETPVDAAGLATERVEIRRVSLRDRPAEPWLTESAQELGAYRAVLETASGPITIELWPDRAPGHVRQFLRLAQAGIYDGMAFHRVAPGFVIQTGALSSRHVPLTERQQKIVINLQPEFSETPHVKGVVSMARGDDPASANTSFFICTATSPALDGKYTAFGRVVDGMAAVEAIERAPRTGETPHERVELNTVRIERK